MSYVLNRIVLDPSSTAREICHCRFPSVSRNGEEISMISFCLTESDREVIPRAQSIAAVSNTSATHLSGFWEGVKCCSDAPGMNIALHESQSQDEAIRSNSKRKKPSNYRHSQFSTRRLSPFRIYKLLSNGPRNIVRCMEGNKVWKLLEGLSAARFMKEVGYRARE